MARRRGRERQIDYWPGFVDALSTLLMAIIFLLSVFVVAQFVLSQQVSSKDTALEQLNAQLAELTQFLALERSSKRSLQDELTSLQSSLAGVEAERDQLRGAASAGAGQAAEAGGRVQALGDELGQQKEISSRALAQVELLNQQIGALRRQIGALEEALEASESRGRESQARIADLGSRLNVALAQRVQELARYRSDFFGRLREILANRPEIRVVGDRFVFQSEVFFEGGSALVSASGIEQLGKLADALLELTREIPSDINWVLRVDGHTDKRPQRSALYPSNWELSSARAIEVVKYLVSRGVPPQRLVAAGFGEHQPLDPADSDEAYARNRRIELKLTER
ncbi:peptidoglycan -binding protein [Terrihabitans rhizophilus]|uniref:Peptidoglycan -binding protein n=1 Tax=Terrihabitans rhizophilus TaxID=3092662 RepID=A0ABU4RPC6_9HYPH|nr:peptidoglycan -binding protein [Terrihabitans sp. PJ23]MDX6806693.1 peptidoglycan -binding protein [Terrihabitans sp. PJ23]